MEKKSLTPQSNIPKLKSAPKIRQIYWCDLQKDFILPEFHKKRPVLIVSKKIKLYDKVTILPFSTKDQIENKNAINLGNVLQNNQDSWVICDYILTISVGRLQPFNKKILRLPEDKFDQVIELMLSILPKPQFK